MPGIQDHDTGTKVDITPALHVPDFGILGTLHVDRQEIGHSSRYCLFAPYLQLTVITHYYLLRNIPLDIVDHLERARIETKGLVIDRSGHLSPEVNALRFPQAK